MTFRGFEYQTVLDIQRTILVAEADLKVIELELKVRHMQRDKISIEELEIKRNIQKNFIIELNNLIENILNDIDLINENLSDLEGKIFMDKFIYGLTNKELANKYPISERQLHRYLSNIDVALNNDVGKGIKRALTE